MSVKIIPATVSRMAEIQAWLEIEQAAYDTAVAVLEDGLDRDVELPERGFLCNWQLVQRSFANDPNNVNVLIVDGAAVGFLNELDILEVKPDRRGMGYGRLLAEFMIERAFVQGHSVVEIEIAPQSALPFWLQMQFTADPDRRGSGGGIYAFKRLLRRFELGDGPRVPFRVAFHTPSRDWDKTSRPFQVFDGMGEMLPDGSIRLPERAYCFDNTQSTSPDCVVTIEVSGELLFEDKVKRPMARDFGLHLDPGYIYFLDVITPSKRRSADAPNFR